MSPGTGVKAPVPRTRTGCLTCRKRKVKCDEAKPHCGKCVRLQRTCVWSDELSMPRSSHSRGFLGLPPAAAHGRMELPRPGGQNFVVEFPNVGKQSMQYIHHFITFCCRFLVYPNDGEGNPLQDQLVPLAVSSPALLHSMAAVAAGHLTRSQGQHELAAAKHYSLALRELNATLSDPKVARADSTLGACLLLCVYEISHSENSLWLQHLQGARDLILYRGGPKTTDYLSRFFSLLDVSGSLFVGGGPLLKGNYWLEDDLPATPDSGKERKTSIQSWPAYDPDGQNSNHFHELMVFMARMSLLSSESMDEEVDQLRVQHDTIRLASELATWWQNCPPKLRDQSFDWRRQVRPQKLTVPETLEEEGISSIKSCMYGCVIYLNHIINPLSREPQTLVVTEAIKGILDIARETPEGYGLEMGLYFGLFMAGIAIFNDHEVEDLLRQKMKADNRVSIYHADRCLELLEVLWGRQHRYGVKYDWRQVQIQMGIQVYVFC